MTKRSRTSLILQAQQIQTETSEKANTQLRIGTMDQDIVDSMVHQDDPPEYPAVHLRYADIPAMLAAYAVHESGMLYYVTSGAAAGFTGYVYYEYKGGGTGVIGDYNVVASENMPPAGFVDMDPQSTPPAHTEARFYYDDVKKNFVFYNDRTGVAGDLLREAWTRSINKTGSGTTNGKAVYISGGSTDLPEVSLAKADVEATAQLLGIFTEDVAIDDDGEVTSFGLVNDIDTSSFSVGDILYLSATTAGQLTNVKPEVPNYVAPAGYVIKSDASTGKIWVRTGHIEPPRAYAINASWSAFSGSTSATNWLKGFYTFNSSVTPVIGGTNVGNTNSAHASHIYVVLGAASTDMVLRFTGTSITDAGVRTPADTEDIDTSGGALDAYFETSKKFIGIVSMTLLSGTAVVVNYGMAAYWDNKNTDFIVTSFEWSGRAGANDAAPNIRLFHHKDTGWTYAAGGAVPPTAIVSMASTYVTERAFVNGRYFKFKRIGLSTLINGSGSEGILVGIDISANNAVANSNMEIHIIGE